MRLATRCLALLLCSWVGSTGAADCSGDFAINSQDDITTLNQCTTFNGNVSLTGTGITDITLNGLEAVTGIINIADSDALLSISSTTLESAYTLQLSKLPKLATLTLPALTNFSKLDFSELPSLRGCEIASGPLQQDVRDISIFSTAIEKLEWLKWPVTSSLLIAGNMNLTEFTLPYAKINVGTSYQFSINNALENLDFSQLTDIDGSLTINGNKDPTMIFDNLQTIDGYARLDGPFTNMSMPILSSIRGALNVRSYVDVIAFCNWLSVQNQLYGHYECTANNTALITTSSATPIPTLALNNTENGHDSNETGSDLSTGAIVGIAVGMVILISVVSTITALLFFRHRRMQKKQKMQQVAAPVDSKKTHSTSTLGEELDASNVRFELGQQETVHELQGPRQVTELDGQTLIEMDVEKPYYRDHKPAPESPVGRFELP